MRQAPWGPAFARTVDSLQLFRDPQRLIWNWKLYPFNQMKQAKTSSWAIYLEPCNKSLGSALFNLCLQVKCKFWETKANLEQLLNLIWNKLFTSDNTHLLFVRSFESIQKLSDAKSWTHDFLSPALTKYIWNRLFCKNIFYLVYKCICIQCNSVRDLASHIS